MLTDHVELIQEIILADVIIPNKKFNILSYSLSIKGAWPRGNTHTLY